MSSLKKSLIVFGLGLSFFLGGIDITAFNLALVWIQRDLSLSLSTTDWVLNSYLLAFGSCIIPAGRIADIYGHRRLFLIGLGIFIFMSLVGGFSQVGWQLVWARAIQGIGTACFWPCIQVICMHIFSKEYVSKVIGYLMFFAGLGLAGGPLFGGLMLQYLSWRYVLWINIPIGLIAFLLVYFILPHKKEEHTQSSIDFISLVLSICFCFSLIYAIDLAGNIGFDNSRVLVWFAAAIGIAWLFIVRQENTKSPLIELHLLKHAPFIMGIVFRISLQFSFFAMIFFTGYALQHILMISPAMAALYFLPYTVTFAFFSVLGGHLSNRYGIERLMYTGMWFMAIGIILYGITIRYSFNYWAVFVPLLLAGFGVGIFIPNNTIFAMHPLPRNYWGVGIGILYMGILLSSSVAVVVSSSFMQSPGTKLALKLLHEKNIPLDSMRIALVESVMSGMKTIPDLLLQFHGKQSEVYIAVKTAFISAMSLEMFITAALILIPMIIFQLCQAAAARSKK